MPYHKINKSSLPSVIAKAKQYRSLLEPDLAISICLDVFAVDQNNQEALGRRAISYGKNQYRMEVALKSLMMQYTVNAHVVEGT